MMNGLQSIQSTIPNGHNTRGPGSKKTLDLVMAVHEKCVSHA